jgi:hypothetical protein
MSQLPLRQGILARLSIAASRRFRASAQFAASERLPVHAMKASFAYDLGYSRNEPCICGSGARFKHCCGQAGGFGSTPPTWPAGKSLLQLLLEADEFGLIKGEEPKARSLKNLMRIANAVQPGGGTILAGPGSAPHIGKAVKLMDCLYRPSDIGMGALHVGAVMFRDIFVRVDIPISFGRLTLDAFEMSDLTPVQQRWLVNAPEEFRRFLDQFLDLADFAYGWTDLQRDAAVDAGVKTYATLTHMQLEPAAATVTAQCDLRGAVQSSLLAAELVLKAAILSGGVPEADLRNNFGHNTMAMSDHLERSGQAVDFSRINDVLRRLPRFVENRYAASQPSRTEVGHILMGAQYVASEIIRCLSGRNVRKDASMTEPRVYPAIP